MAFCLIKNIKRNPIFWLYGLYSYHVCYPFNIWTHLIFIYVFLCICMHTYIIFFPHQDIKKSILSKIWDPCIYHTAKNILRDDNILVICYYDDHGIKESVFKSTLRCFQPEIRVSAWWCREKQKLKKLYFRMLEVYSFIHPFTMHWLSPYYMPGTTPATRDLAGDENDRTATTEGIDLPFAMIFPPNIY